ncbi:cobalt-precorrin-5B (C(1))-methyltransferase CbiD [Butyrivibrio sp. VCB2006]|uniref:cobalt-precorrin-5B (C(1))-methyltransferase CbiD n=1 Tax=Butyrivibrio sp. VCB2006 TaxID=1280679 RepID=UPI0003FA17F7|nr:cobalt-precorrin-5B (C(1))-methyltransferase CbiD [Butyrivibrio sp. VCB2006]
MNKGFTTGSCAAAASKAAAFMLLSGQKKLQIAIDTPAGVKYNPQIEDIEIGEGYVSCAVRKQSGDDPDITNGTLVFARVSFTDEKTSGDGKDIANKDSNCRKVYIDGGKGVGRVTRPGLDQPVGNAAINSVPRQMIENEIMQVMDLFDYERGLDVIISVPEGEELAAKTFNPRLGIEGGISIIGTTGIVEPMSTKALLDTIMVELRQMKAMGATVAVVSPGNYGMEFMKEAFDYDLDKAVKCSNFIGDTIDMAAELGFKKLLLCGHVGKLIKVSGGIMNTHSREADCRMELMATAAIRSGASADAAREILDCVSTEEAMEIYLREGLDKQCFDYIMDRIDFFLCKRAADRLEVECIVYSNQYGLLGKTEHAEDFLREAKG